MHFNVLLKRNTPIFVAICLVVLYVSERPTLADQIVAVTTSDRITLQPRTDANRDADIAAAKAAGLFEAEGAETSTSDEPLSSLTISERSKSGADRDSIAPASNSANVPSLPRYDIAEARREIPETNDSGSSRPGLGKQPTISSSPIFESSRSMVIQASAMSSNQCEPEVIIYQPATYLSSSDLDCCCSDSISEFSSSEIIISNKPSIAIMPDKPIGEPDVLVEPLQKRSIELPIGKDNNAEDSDSNENWSKLEIVRTRDRDMVALRPLGHLASLQSDSQASIAPSLSSSGLLESGVTQASFQDGLAMPPPQYSAGPSPAYQPPSLPPPTSRAIAPSQDVYPGNYPANTSNQPGIPNYGNATVTPLPNNPLPSSQLNNQTNIQPTYPGSYEAPPTYPRGARVVSGEPYVTEGPCQFDAYQMVEPISYQSSTGCGQVPYSPLGPQPTSGQVPGYYAPPTIMPNQVPNLYSSNNAGYRPLFGFGQQNYNVQFGRGIFGQPVAYVPGQKFRNFFRYVFP